MPLGGTWHLQWALILGPGGGPAGRAPRRSRRALANASGGPGAVAARPVGTAGPAVRFSWPQAGPGTHIALFWALQYTPLVSAVATGRLTSSSLGPGSESCSSLSQPERHEPTSPGPGGRGPGTDSEWPG
jgi:hypothetical protein